MSFRIIDLRSVKACTDKRFETLAVISDGGGKPFITANGVYPVDVCGRVLDKGKVMLVDKSMRR